MYDNNINLKNRLDMLQLINLMRPYQWIKNLLCFAGVVFGFHFTNVSLITNAIFVFIVFCCIASCIYILNDIIDIKEDRLHPKKKYRPIASGKVKVNCAIFFSILLCIIAIVLGIYISYKLLIIILLYGTLNIFYSFYGKHVVLLDVFIISFGFLLRLVAGTLAIGIPITGWITLCVIMLTLFLGFAKRRAELLYCEINHVQLNLKRKVLEHYEPRMLDIFLSITACGTILSYSLFSVIASTHKNIIYTVIFVLYGVFRYVYMLYKTSGGEDTANDLLDDKHLIITLILWVSSYMGLSLYYA